MASKPATPAAARGVPGAPRVLVYVADSRQLEPGAAAPAEPPPLYPPDLPVPVALPRNALYRSQSDAADRNPPNTIFYKPLNNDGKLNTYGPGDSLVQRTDFLPVAQQFLKESFKLDESKPVERQSNIAVRRDCSNSSINSEVCGVESYNSRIPIESGELATYQTRCHGPVGADSAALLQPIVVQHGFNQFTESGSVNCEGRVSDRELADKSFVNYQFLEQSVSHQSIVNQSISILNQQVGVSRVSEGEGPQLVRTSDGLVLAVLPSTATQPDSSELSCRTAQSESSQTITVPLGWRRIVSGTSVLYISPSGTALSTLPQLRDYLQTAGTCKCGLPCPLRPETTFSFDSKVASKPYQAASGAELTKLCNHKRKLLATLQARAQSPSTPPPIAEQKKAVGTELNALKKKMKKRAAFPNMSVSQLMVQRERPLVDFKAHDNEHNRTVSPARAAPAHDDQHEHVQRGPHYLTVNSGWITQQQEAAPGPKAHQPGPGVQNPLNVGLPVLGTNGQIIGVNTGYNKHTFKNAIMQPSDPEQKEDKKETPPTLLQSKPKEDESQIFCGLNQPLTPEVMQKINEQQQLFIQQNQKQIEMAMKGYRTQLAESANQKLQGHNYVPQGQLVIQNGAVVKTNPAKTPPWQVKRNDAAPNPMASPSPKPPKFDLDYEDPSMNISDDAPAVKNNFINNDPINQTMCPRVPPLPQHYNMMGQQWPNADLNKKKLKNNNKGSKKKNNVTENKIMTFSNGMRLVQESKGKSCEDMSSNNVPSFMDDPNGYLAQQTVLLNNTISRQVGINSSFDNGQYENTSNCYANNQPDKSFKPLNKSCDMNNVYRSNMVPNASPSPNNTPDSSVLSDKTQDGTQCCKGCNVYKGNHADFPENQMRLKYMKHNMYKMEIDGNRGDARLPSPHGFDDNPVTSSTFMERSPLHDTCGPIQAGTVSTSNVSPSEKLQPPEPSPTSSNSSRNTDTPHSNGSGSQFIPNCTFPIHSPAYSNASSYRDSSNPSTPSGQYQYHSPGPPTSQSITGTQMMHFISNHNVNKNLMEVDNISMVGVKPGLKLPQEIFRVESRKRIENSMPGYCPPPHLGGGPAHSLVQSCYVQTLVTTMASGFSVTRDTVTSVLAGKANTATTSINASQINFIRPPPPPSVNLATTYAIPNNQPDPFINSVNLPTSYPLHIAGTTAQNMISKSPLEMVQNVIGNGPVKPETSTATPMQINRRPCPPTTPGQILISSTGQIIVSNNHMPPPPPKTTTVASPIQGSSGSTSVTASVAQLVPAVNQVVVNTLPTPFVIQPPMMAVDGQVVQPNTMLPQIVAGGLVPGQSPNESPRQIDVNKGPSFMSGVAMLSPESLKKRSKKKKTSASITNVLQITAPQQNPNNIMVQHTSPQQNSSPQFSPRGFQLSPNNNISSAPMLQALTIVPGKSGTPAHIVMNGQSNSNNFGSQQILANTSPSQQINLLQPVNLINNASNVMPNFPAFQQFIVPNIGGMVMTADGTIIQDNSNGMPMQLQLQTVNGQNVLTPVQNPGVFTAGANGGVVIRAQNQQGKIIQSQHSPGAQFLSPNSQVMMNSPNFSGQLSPLLANLSPTNVAFNAPQVRPGNVQQEFIQTNQMGQTLMVPLSPKQSLAPANRTNTFVQQNTTIVQQQTTLVSNSQTHSSLALGGSRLSIDPNVLLAPKQIQKRNFDPPSPEKEEKFGKFQNDEYGKAILERAHSVSTQTLLARKSPGGSPPDTTTHSPLGEPARSPRYPSRPDTTTAEPEPDDAAASVSATPPPQPARSPRYPSRPDTTTAEPEPDDAAASVSATPPPQPARSPRYPSRPDTTTAEPEPDDAAASVSATPPPQPARSPRYPSRPDTTTAEPEPDDAAASVSATPPPQPARSPRYPSRPDTTTAEPEPDDAAASVSATPPPQPARSPRYPSRPDTTTAEPEPDDAAASVSATPPPQPARSPRYPSRPDTTTAEPEPDDAAASVSATPPPQPARSPRYPSRPDTTTAEPEPDDATASVSATPPPQPARSPRYPSRPDTTTAEPEPGDAAASVSATPPPQPARSPRYPSRPDTTTAEPEPDDATASVSATPPPQPARSPRYPSRPDTTTAEPEPGDAAASVSATPPPQPARSPRYPSRPDTTTAEPEPDDAAASVSATPPPQPARSPRYPSRPDTTTAEPEPGDAAASVSATPPPQLARSPRYPSRPDTTTAEPEPGDAAASVSATPPPQPARSPRYPSRPDTTTAEPEPDDATASVSATPPPQPARSPRYPSRPDTTTAEPEPGDAAASVSATPPPQPARSPRYPSRPDTTTAEPEPDDAAASVSATPPPQPARSPRYPSRPDTTTAEPEPGDAAASVSATPPPQLARSPRYPSRPDTTTAEPEPDDAAASAMVQCVSSSEQDMAESREHAWPAPRPDFNSDTDAQSVMSNLPLMRQNRNHNPVESTDMHYNQPGNPPANQNLMPVTTNYYERTHTYKRKNDFGDGSTYRTDKMMRTSYGMVHGLPREDYDVGLTSDKQVRHFPPSGTSSDSSTQKVFDRHNLGPGNDVGRARTDCAEAGPDAGPGGGPTGGRVFSAGQLVWGPVRGHASWPGALRRRAADGRWAVRWFGEPPPPPGLLPGAALLTLSEGLEAHHAARTKHRKSRKLNTLLENAIQEAMAELDKKSEATETEGPQSDATEDEPVVDTPKRRRRERPRSRDKHRKARVGTKAVDTRLRSSR